MDDILSGGTTIQFAIGRAVRGVERCLHLGLVLFADGVELAIDAGYRLFDTAQEYGSEEAIGNALKKATNNGPMTPNAMEFPIL